ncbi:MAG: MASE3 domain-containing protein [bacterium]
MKQMIKKLSGEEYRGKQFTLSHKWLTILAIVLVLSGLYLTASLCRGFNAHMLVELLGVIVASSIFMFAWNSRRFQDNNYFLFIGIAYLFIGVLDLAHTMAYQGTILSWGSVINLTVQLRIAARYVESVSFLIAPLFIGRKLRARYVFLSYITATSLLLGSILSGSSPIFPDCFIEGTGLTLFNTISELCICLVLLASIALLAQKGGKFDPGVLRLLIASVILTIGSEMTFTIYAYTSFSSNFIGHSLGAVSYYLIYKAIIETGLMEPYRLLFRNLKASEESIKAAYAELDQIFNTAADAMRLVDKDFNILKANRTFLTLAGLSQNQVMGKKCYQTFPGSACHTPQCPLVRIQGGEEYIEFDVEKMRSDGQTISCILTATPFRRSGGELIGIVEDFKDITERKRAEAALRESEERFRLVMETVQDVFWIAAPGATEMLYISPAYEKVWGLSRESLYRSPFSFTDSIHPDDREQVLSEIKNCPTGPWSVEYRIVRPDRSVRWIHDRGFPIQDKNGNFSKVIGTAMDITERKTAAEELRKYRSHLEELVKERTYELSRAVELLKESELKYSTLIEKAMDGVIVVQDGVYKFVNEYMATMSGYTIDELINKPVTDLAPPEYRDQIAQRISLRLTGEKMPSHYESKIQDKNGTVKDVDISVGLIQYQGKPAIIGIMRDVTERKHMEVELQRVQKLESLGILAGGIAHDFNNLLTAIVGNLSLMDKYIQPASRASETLDAVKKASQKAKHLTHQLLTFSKGGAPIKKTASVSELIKDTAGFSLSGSRTRCDISLPDDLWWAEIDEGQIGQVINNLLINADQAMPEGGIITIRAENVMVRASDGLPLKEGRYIRIAVRDQGTGIPCEYLHKIFDPFFTTKPKGNGLGLAITYSIVKKHGGHITVESKAGTGTVFSIYLPASEKELFIVRGVVEQESIITGQGRVLVMDDQPSIRETTGQILSDLGYEVELAAEGNEVIELYVQAKKSGHPFDALILDLTIPGGMGGDEAIRKLREIDPQVKAIVSSGYSNDPIMSEFREYGFREVVAKPYEINELSKVLSKVLMEEKTPPHPDRR